jgi:hypothetical protein
MEEERFKEEERQRKKKQEWLLDLKKINLQNKISGDSPTVGPFEISI